MFEITLKIDDAELKADFLKVFVDANAQGFAQFIAGEPGRGATVDEIKNATEQDYLDFVEQTLSQQILDQYTAIVADKESREARAAAIAARAGSVTVRDRSALAKKQAGEPARGKRK